MCKKCAYNDFRLYLEKIYSKVKGERKRKVKER